MTKTIAVLGGDGIGPEVIDIALQVLDRLGLDVRTEAHDFGGIAIDRHGDPLPASTLEACRNADAILLGAIGGPKWTGAGRTPEAGLLQIRKELGLFANIRPVVCHPGQEKISPLKDERAAGADLVIVRELTGGLYFGEKQDGEERATDLCVYTAGEVERVARIAFELARQRGKKLTSIDKANVLATSRLWRRAVERMAAEYPDVAVSHELVDSAAMKLVLNPTDYDVIVTENLFGDILSDLASAIPGSIGFLGSASLGSSGPGMYEPIHGSAPDIAGKNLANPVGAVVSLALLLRHSLGETEAADRIDARVASAARLGNDRAALIEHLLGV